MSVLLWKEIYEIADAVCKEFRLTYGKIVPETRKKKRNFGECQACDRCSSNDAIDETNCSEKVLYIRIHQLNRPRKPLDRYTILHTLAHELAHLPPGYWKHGKKHQDLMDRIMIFIKEQGYL